MELKKANEILGGLVDALTEGKKVEIEWPDLSADVKSLPLKDRTEHPKNVEYHKGISAVKAVDIPRAVKQVMTWKKDLESVDSFYSVIRMIGRGVKRDLVFSVYDLDPDGPKRSNKYRASVYMRRSPSSTTIIGEYKSVRAAKDAARKWLIEQSRTFQARSLERISFNYKKLG
jgi:hypothetical protein